MLSGQQKMFPGLLSIFYDTQNIFYGPEKCSMAHRKSMFHSKVHIACSILEPMEHGLWSIEHAPLDQSIGHGSWILKHVLSTMEHVERSCAAMNMRSMGDSTWPLDHDVKHVLLAIALYEPYNMTCKPENRT